MPSLGLDSPVLNGPASTDQHFRRLAETGELQPDGEDQYGSSAHYDVNEGLRYLGSCTGRQIFYGWKSMSDAQKRRVALALPRRGEFCEPHANALRAWSMTPHTGCSSDLDPKHPDETLLAGTPVLWFDLDPDVFVFSRKHMKIDTGFNFLYFLSNAITAPLKSFGSNLENSQDSPPMKLKMDSILRVLTGDEAYNIARGQFLIKDPKVSVGNLIIIVKRPDAEGGKEETREKRGGDKSGTKIYRPSEVDILLAAPQQHVARSLSLMLYKRAPFTHSQRLAKEKLLGFLRYAPLRKVLRKEDTSPSFSLSRKKNFERPPLLNLHAPLEVEQTLAKGSFNQTLLHTFFSLAPTVTDIAFRVHWQNESPGKLLTLPTRAWEAIETDVTAIRIQEIDSFFKATFEEKGAQPAALTELLFRTREVASMRQLAKLTDSAVSLVVDAYLLNVLGKMRKCGVRGFLTIRKNIGAEGTIPPEDEVFHKSVQPDQYVRAKTYMVGAEGTGVKGVKTEASLRPAFRNHKDLEEMMWGGCPEFWAFHKAIDPRQKTTFSDAASNTLDAGRSPPKSPVKVKGLDDFSKEESSEHPWRHVRKTMALTRSKTTKSASKVRNIAVSKGGFEADASKPPGVPDLAHIEFHRKIAGCLQRASLQTVELDHYLSAHMTAHTASDSGPSAHQVYIPNQLPTSKSGIRLGKLLQRQPDRGNSRDAFGGSSRYQNRR